MSIREYEYVADLVASNGGCDFLVFGVGNDSRLWLEANPQGRTVFLEDSEYWARGARNRLPRIDIRSVQYYTTRSQWRELLAGDPERLTLELPEDVIAGSWDVILVDAPAGFSDECPGRMKSLYMASVLARTGGADVLVHDCDRVVERVYCDHFLGKLTLRRELDRMRHYVCPLDRRASPGPSLRAGPR
jgi:glucuronoxylan 4-O-methyltransferase